MEKIKNNAPLVVLLIVLGGLFLRFIALGAYPLTDKTESRYAEIAREMVATNNWITLQLDPGVAFWAKPPLSTWATAICYKLFGISEVTARLSSFIFLSITIFLIYNFANLLQGKLFALKASLLLVTTGVFYFMMGGVMTDPAFCFAITLAMVSFYLAIDNREKNARLMWGYLFFIGMGLSVLAKGPLGIIFILFPIVLWKIFTKTKVAPHLPWVSGILLLFIMVVPWHIMAEIKTPGFLKYYLYGEHFERFLAPGWKGDMYGEAHAQPKGMIWVLLFAATFPWWIFLVPNIVSAWKKKTFWPFIKESEASYCLFFVVTPLLFFTFSGNILMTYLLPSLPAFALFTAYLMEHNQRLSTGDELPWFLRLKIIKNVAVLVIVFFTLGALTIAPSLAKEKSHKDVAKLFNQLNTNEQAKLIYTKQMPFSADFYTDGRAVDLSEGISVSKLFGYINDEYEDYYVIYKEDEGWFGGEIPLLEKVGEFKKYSLYKEKPQSEFSPLK